MGCTMFNPIAAVFVNFGLKLLAAIINENILKKIFFYCARRLAAYTDTPIDDRFVEELYKEFNKVKEDNSEGDSEPK